MLHKRASEMLLIPNYYVPLNEELLQYVAGMMGKKLIERQCLSLLF